MKLRLLWCGALIWLFVGGLHGKEIEMVSIPAGKAHLGSNAEEKQFGYRIGSAAAKKWGWFDQEKERTVDVPQFSIMRHLVTQSQYAQFVQATSHRVPHISAKDYQTQGFLVHAYTEVQPYLWATGKPPVDRLDDPVVLVSVDDAQAYCAWQGQQSSNIPWRLPNENEWEKAARGTDHRYFPWGNAWRPNHLNSAQKGPYRTTAVNRYPEGHSPYGVWDMAGNVFQWTETPIRPNSPRFVLKGCSWDDHPGICRSAARHSRLKTSRHILIGFRCVQAAT